MTMSIASSLVGRDGPYVSIGLKIFTVAVMILALMCAATALTVSMATQVSRELDLLGHGYMEAYAAMARANIRSLARAVLIRRLYINERDGEGRTPSDELVRRARDAGEAVTLEVTAARGFIEKALAGNSSLRDPVALSRLNTLLEVALAKRAEIVSRQTQLIDTLEGGGDASAARPMMAELDEEREDYDRQLDEARRELFAIVSDAADAARAAQNNVVRAVVGITGLAGLLGLLVAGGLARGLSRPVRRLLDGTKAVENGELDTVVPVTSRDEIGMLTRSFNAMVAELKLKARIKETFGRYVDPRIVQGLIDQPDLLAGKGDRRVMTVLFCDLWNSTALGELTTPAGLVTIINRYLAKMSGPVRSHDGIIDKYMGDGLMAFWGPPFVGADEQARLACEAALDQVAALPALAAELPELLGIRRGLPSLAIRVGIATGDVLVGNIGSDTARSYTVMGGTVNLASRLEGINRRYGTSILASAATARLAAEAIEFREVDAATIAGLAEPEPVFEVLGRKGEVAATVLEARDRFAEGLAAFRAGDQAAAVEAFAGCLALRPDDQAARDFLQRLEAVA